MKKFFKKPFFSAKDEIAVKQNTKEKEYSPKAGDVPSYHLAFLDQEFLLREELRPVRLQLELLKPELIQQEQEIEATVVIFGSARIADKKTAQAKLQESKIALNEDPSNSVLLQHVRAAESLLAKADYYEAAKQIAINISKLEEDKKQIYYVVTGGGPGIMEAANYGAYKAGKKSIGMGIALPMEEKHNDYVTPDLCFKFHYFALRKMHFLIRAKAVFAFPGGFGTLDEVFEALTLMQTGKIQQIPLILYSRSYWGKIINFNALLEDGVISPEDLNLIRYADTPEEALNEFLSFYNSADK